MVVMGVEYFFEIKNFIQQNTATEKTIPLLKLKI